MATTTTKSPKLSPTQPARHARVLGQKKPDVKKKTTSLKTSLDLNSKQSISLATSPATGSRSESPARIDSPISIGSIESISSVTSDETAAQSTSLSCPICGESMVTLLQLNRHIDDAHSEIEKSEEDQVKSWFKKKVVKAKQLQSVTSAITKFSKLDLFDLEDTNSSLSEQSISSKRSASSVPVAPTNPAFVVTRAHWQKPTGFDRCSDIVCEKPLSARNGSVNCRKCGKLFCSAHTRYQMKLNQNANHDPINGIWSRVCETCYKSRPGYSDTTGVARDRFSDLLKKRRALAEKRDLEVIKLENRLVKLIKILIDPKFSSDSANVFTYSKATQLRSLEKEIVTWENDEHVKSCPICKHKFGYTLRKHHCRVCGKVVCGNLSTKCSLNVPISILVTKLEHSFPDEIPNSTPIRMCTDCKDTIFSHRNFASELVGPPPDLFKVFNSLKPLKRAIDNVLPKFQNLLAEINNPDIPPSPELLRDATKIRTRLLDLFVQLDNTSRKVMTIKVHSEVERRLQKQIYSVNTQYLQDNMLPLKSLPKILKHNKQAASQLSEVSTMEEEESNIIKLPPDEIQKLREQIIVLEEQKFLVSSMVNEANTRRKFDEIEPLKESLNELEKELTKLRDQLGIDAI